MGRLDWAGQCGEAKEARQRRRETVDLRICVQFAAVEIDDVREREVYTGGPKDEG
jgi:hypothetical protein